MDKWMRNLRKELEAQGFEMIEKKKGWMVKPPKPDAQMVMLHLTNSDHRAQANALAELRKAGFLTRR